MKQSTTTTSLEPIYYSIQTKNKIEADLTTLIPTAAVTLHNQFSALFEPLEDHLATSIVL